MTLPVNDLEWLLIKQVTPNHPIFYILHHRSYFRIGEVINFKFGRAYIHWPIISKRSVVAWPILNFWGLNHIHISGTTEAKKSARFCTHAGHLKLLALEWQDTPVPHVVIVRVVWCILEFYIPWNISGMAKTKDFKFCTRVGHVKSSHFVRRLIVMSSSICVIKFRNIVAYSWSRPLKITANKCHYLENGTI